MHNVHIEKTSPEIYTVTDLDINKVYKFKPYIKREKINERIDQMAVEIKRYYLKNFENQGGQDIILICVLNGAMGFFTQLAERLFELGVNCEVDTFKVSSRDGIKISEEVVIKKTLSTRSTKDKILIFVEDLIDTGLNLNTIWNDFKDSDAKKVLFVSLFIKKEIAKLCEDVENNIISIGIEIKKEFIIGCWLDYNQYFRGMKDIWIMFEENDVN